MSRKIDWNNPYDFRIGDFVYYPERGAEYYGFIDEIETAYDRDYDGSYTYLKYHIITEDGQHVNKSFRGFNKPKRSPKTKFPFTIPTQKIGDKVMFLDPGYLDNRLKVKVEGVITGFRSNENGVYFYTNRYNGGVEIGNIITEQPDDIKVGDFVTRTLGSFYGYIVMEIENGEARWLNEKKEKHSSPTNLLWKLDCKNQPKFELLETAKILAPVDYGRVINILGLYNPKEKKITAFSYCFKEKDSPLGEHLLSKIEKPKVTPKILRIEVDKLITNPEIKVGDAIKSKHWFGEAFYATEIKNGKVYYYNGRKTARVSEPIEDLRKTIVPTPRFKIGDKIKSTYYDETYEVGTVIAYIWEGDKINYIVDTPVHKKSHLIREKWAVAADSSLGAVENTGDLLQSDSDVYDAKSRVNLAPDKKIPESIINKLRKDGLSLEDVDSLINDGFPIRKYKTQITIHGKCPRLDDNRTSRGYVTLERNNNESLGVRWRAIDEGKKYRILRDYLQWYGYRSDSNSQEFSFVKTIENQDEKTDWEIATRLKEQFTKLLEAKVFFGGVSISKPVRKGWITMPYFYIKLSINGIYEKNIPRFVELVLNKDFATIEKEVAEAKAEYERRKKERQDEYKKEEAERQAKEAKERQYFDEQKAEWLKNNTSIPAGWEEIEYKPNEVFRTNDILHWYYGVLSYLETQQWPNNDDYTFKVKDYYYVVKGKKGDFYLNYCDSEGNITDRHHSQFPATLRSTLRILRKLPVAKPATTAAASQPRPAAPAPSALFRKIDYSAKAIAVVGDTKPVKDELEDIGGKFNSHLSCGAGYIFSKAKSEAAVDEWVSRKNSEIILCKESEKI